jgi:hypothetical protein
MARSDLWHNLRTDEKHQIGSKVIEGKIQKKIVYPECPGPDQPRINDFPDFRYPNSKTVQWSEKNKNGKNASCNNKRSETPILNATLSTVYYRTRG